MLYGRTALALKIRLMKYVVTHPEWKCTPSCFTCKYWETCYYSMLCEEGEIIEREVFEYRVRSEAEIYFTLDYRDAMTRIIEWRNLGKDPILERRKSGSDAPWYKMI